MDECKSFVRRHIENDNILVFSSILFLIPAYVAYINELYIYSINTFITSLISIHNWLQYRYTNKSTTLDKIFARTTFLLYVITGCFVVKSNLLIFLGLLDALNCIMFYNISWQCVEDKYTTNILHFLLHIGVLLGMLIIVSGC